MTHASVSPGSGPTRIIAPPPEDPRALPLWFLSSALSDLREDLGRLARPKICDAAYARGFDDALAGVRRVVDFQEAVGRARALILLGDA